MVVPAWDLPDTVSEPSRVEELITPSDVTGRRIRMTENHRVTRNWWYRGGSSVVRGGVDIPGRRWHYQTRRYLSGRGTRVSVSNGVGAVGGVGGLDDRRWAVGLEREVVPASPEYVQSFALIDGQRIRWHTVFENDDVLTERTGNDLRDLVTEGSVPQYAVHDGVGKKVNGVRQRTVLAVIIQRQFDRLGHTWVVTLPVTGLDIAKNPYRISPEVLVQFLPPGRGLEVGTLLRMGFLSALYIAAGHRRGESRQCVAHELGELLRVQFAELFPQILASLVVCFAVEQFIPNLVLSDPLTDYAVHVRDKLR